ncbi:VOC family protein [Sphaerisporangium sp. TRM90804]|uniref:VOC family protein n=1 Tax=Sphaerisporangium sp. TRM90804 TaxID=3031113 RepID=UPI00244D3397|nr:VOC family protein [Sphaerisporangium sp. TRM90804]MDH2428915.1 VOC family protein [Sphaerisporangium sp. TRM90804]
MIKIAVASVFVEDQAEALAFYTDVVGFAKKQDIPVGDARWLTVASPAGPEGVELLLEPNGNPIAKTYQQGLFEAGIPATTFASDDIHADYARMKALGVVFTSEPVRTGPVSSVTFEDTCGNLIGLHQVH